MDEIEQFLHGRREAKEDDMKEINLSQGRVTIVDDDDFEEISKHKWNYAQGYAKRNIAAGAGKQATLHMHVAIMGKTGGLEIDHVNGNGLDNRRDNLQFVTHAQNLQNKAPDKNTSSVYKGVSWNKRIKRWTSQIMIDKKLRHLGRYENEQAAALAYNNAAIKHFGQYARLNTIMEG